MLRDLASRFDRLVIDTWQEDLSLFIHKIVMAFDNMIPQAIDMQKGLIDEAFHELLWISQYEAMHEVRETYRKCTSLLVWEGVLATHCILEINWFHRSTNQEEYHDSFGSIFFV
jgi:hypothetical protein